MEDDINPMKHEIKIMREQLNMCIHKMDDMENRLRRKNIRVLGLPGKSEGNNPTEYTEDWLKGMFGKDCLSKFFSIERAHRVPLRTLAPGGQPRPLLIKLLNFKRTKLLFFKKAREMKEIQYNGAKISIYPDLSPKLKRQNAGCSIKRLNMQCFVQRACGEPIWGNIYIF